MSNSSIFQAVEADLARIQLEPIELEELSRHIFAEDLR